MTDAKQPDENTPGAGDPWAPPERGTFPAGDRASGSGTPSWQPDARPGEDGPSGPYPPSVHDRPTVTSMPAAGFTPPAGAAPFDVPGPAVPPPPVAPTGPGAPGGYGYPGYPAGYGWSGMPAPRQNGMGTAALVLGILACCLFCAYGVVSVVLGILAVVFGVKGRKNAERGLADNHGQAQAGLITGVIGIVLGVAVIVLLAIGITAAINSEEDGWEEEGSYGAHRPAAAAPVLR